ncbi:MAG: MFS transporter [Candidatus Thorarchaeota archaeon]|nr:MFS transporter [Candidatus Thorarchaeota archaeon]
MLPFYKKVAYGMGRFGSSFLLSLTGLTAFWIYGTVFELNWFLNGIALGVSYVVIGLTHWLTGYYSDSVETRWGRRKPFVVIGAPGLALTGFMVFIPNWFLDTATYAANPEANVALGWTIFAYYLFFICAFKFFYAFLLTAFQAWMPEITDEDERALVSSMQNTSNWIANGLGVVIGFITPVLFIAAEPGLSSLGLTVVLAFAIITVLFYLPSIIWVREKEGIVIPKRSMVEETKTVLRNDIYVKWFMVVGFLSFSFSAITTQIVGYAQEILLLTSLDLLLPPAMALLASIMIFLYIWIKLVARIGKGKSMYISLFVLAVLLCLTPFLGALIGTVSNVLVATLYFVPLAATMAVYYLMSYIVPADIAHVDELVTGQSRAGIYEGFKGVPLNMFQAVSAVLLGWFMDYSEITTGGTEFGYLWWGPFFAPFLVVAALILKRTNIDPDFEELKHSSGPDSPVIEIADDSEIQ